MQTTAVIQGVIVPEVVIPERVDSAEQLTPRVKRFATKPVSVSRQRVFKDYVMLPEPMMLGGMESLN